LTVTIDSTTAEAATARRLRFRQAVSDLVSQAESQDLLRWILLPGALAVVLGFVLMLFGWVGAARTFREIEQIPYLISGGLVGLGMVFLGALLLASAFWTALLKKFQEEADERNRAHLRALEDRLDRLFIAATAEGSPARPRSGPRRPPKRPAT
jgi:cell division protein FtsX